MVVTVAPQSTSRDWQPVVQSLEKLLDAGRVMRRKEELLVYECDGLTSYRERPAVVTLPKTTEEVAAVVRFCHEQNIPFVTRGAGTGLSGGALPIQECVLIVTTCMQEILDIDYGNQQVVVQPGVINNWITQAVSGAGFYYAPDPSSQLACSIGGNVAENSGGVHCLKYGVTVNHVLGLKLVLPDGEVVEVGGPVSETPGYDLTGVFVGSEGTLGIVTEVTLRILKVPESVQVTLADFTSVEAAGKTVSDIISAGIIPAGMEMMDNFSLNAVEDTVGTNCYPRDAVAILLIEIDGAPAEVAASAKQIEEICYGNGARQLVHATDKADRLRLWKGRKAAFAAMGQISPDYYVQDGVIPRTRLPEVLKEIAQLGEKHGYRVANVFHAGDGNLHPLILYNNSVPGELEAVEALGGDILKACVRVGGSISGEHGIGADKRCYMADMFSDVDLETMQWVRVAINRKGLANPTKIFPTPRTCGEAAQKAVGEFKGLERF
ncbi:MAG: FAD-linked oxidase C-terminal domain-containing protein [Cyanobacteria bacterium J06626_6]